jgi:hypothetical protein
MLGYRVWRRGDGRYELRLPPAERAILAQLPEALLPVLENARDGAGAAPEAARLFPPAYPDDAEAERSYREVVHQDLLGHHRGALETVSATVDSKFLDDEQAASWLAALNDVRLVLGTTLGVSEDGVPALKNEIDGARWSLYGYLSLLVEQLVGAMSGALPPPVPAADDLVPDDPWGEPPSGLRWSAPGAPATAESVRAPRTPRGRRRRRAAPEATEPAPSASPPAPPPSEADGVGGLDA